MWFWVLCVKRLRFGVDAGEVEEFVVGNDCVGEFLGRYEGATRLGYGRVLCCFFKWLRLEGVDLEPKAFVDLVAADRSKGLWGRGLVLKFTRDNGVFVGRASSYKYFMFVVLKQFFDYHLAPIAVGNVFGKRGTRKYKPKQIDVAKAKRVLGCVSQRERAILLIMLQSGMSIGDVLNKFNFMLEEVSGCVEAGEERLRVEFQERKRNNFSYFTFISRDAIQELKKWLAVRSRWLEGKPDPGAVFINKSGRPMTINCFNGAYLRALEKAELKKGPFSVTSHMFRKLFKTESRPPERAIDQDCIEFMMGHLSGIESVGGIYDRTPELYAGVIEKEYEKLEPYVNVYSGEAVRGAESNLSAEDWRFMKRLLEDFKSGKLTWRKSQKGLAETV